MDGLSFSQYIYILGKNKDWSYLILKFNVVKIQSKRGSIRPGNINATKM